MKLENTFTVDAPLDQTWNTLLDIERVAKCLPGAEIEAGDEDGVFQGAMKMKLGPLTMDYRGTAVLQDVDEESRTASIAVQARETRGQGTAAAVISNHLEPDDAGTKVVAVTDLNITGRPAQFGRGIMEDVAGTMMSQFAERLELEIKGGEGGDTVPVSAVSSTDAAAVPDESVTEEPASPRPAEGAPAVEPLDVGNVLMGTPMLRQAGIAALAGVLVLAVIALLRGRGRKLTLNVNLSR